MCTYYFIRPENILPNKTCLRLQNAWRKNPCQIPVFWRWAIIYFGSGTLRVMSSVHALFEAPVPRYIPDRLAPHIPWLFYIFIGKATFNVFKPQGRGCGMVERDVSYICSACFTVHEIDNVGSLIVSSVDYRSSIFTGCIGRFGVRNMPSGRPD